MKDASILITGGSGSFGQAFARRCLTDGAKRVCVYSRGEHKQALMAAEFSDTRMRWFIGDVRDRDRLRRAMEGCDIVVHAAALKRIEVGYYNPSEMVKTNVMGALHVVEAAMDAHVRRVVALSTDKAFQPVSAYGDSKALAERIFLAANNTRGAQGPKFAVTRYGNIAGSEGSVIPKWASLIEGGAKKVPVTDPQATRFYMTIGEAVDLVCKAIVLMPDYVLVPTLPAYRLSDLAEAMGVEMEVKGLPDWEKKHESLKEGMSSEHARRMSVPELREALSRLGALPILKVAA